MPFKLILQGPTASGKTTLANLLVDTSNLSRCMVQDPESVNTIWENAAPGIVLLVDNLDELTDPMLTALEATSANVIATTISFPSRRTSIPIFHLQQIREGERRPLFVGLSPAGATFSASACAVCGKATEKGQMLCGGNYCVVHDAKPGSESLGGDPSEFSNDAPTVVNESGGRQSKLSFRFDLLVPEALFELANIVHDGEIKYGEGNWRKISARSHINHGIVHLFAWLMGNREDRHLGHAFCRIMMAMGVENEEGLLD